ncbi:MAG: helix-turn-helix transcriptional regulator [Cyclobacteriaceae bacterium]|nr:helix-turn-helix transcriptional regulator [Cyclobacteriaceae bacterium]
MKTTLISKNKKADYLVSLINELDRPGNSLLHKVNRIIEQEQFMRERQKEFECLTERERQILKLLAHGHNNPQIADKLFISRYTVEQHRKNLNRKLGASSFADSYQFALAFNLV